MHCAIGTVKDKPLRVNLLDVVLLSSVVRKRGSFWPRSSPISERQQIPLGDPEGDLTEVEVGCMILVMRPVGRRLSLLDETRMLGHLDQDLQNRTQEFSL